MEVESSSSTNIYHLPEGCISHIISFTSPRDACRAAAVSTFFNSAAASDTVWEKFLPSAIQSILERAVEPLSFASKKELYFRLCNSILIDNGYKSFLLDKQTGGKCFILSARQLDITWGDTEEYWRWIQHPHSRFAEVVKLISVCWLNIKGYIDCKDLTPKMTYKAHLFFKIDDEAYGLSDTQKAYVSIGAQTSNNIICLHPNEPDNSDYSDDPDDFNQLEVKLPTIRDDGWEDMEMGEFYNDDGEDGQVEIALQEIEKLWWKGGLIIEGFGVRPKT